MRGGCDPCLQTEKMTILFSHHYQGAILIAPKSESAYFDAYRKAFPEEVFDVCTIEEVRERFLLLDNGLIDPFAYLLRNLYLPKYSSLILKPFLTMRDRAINAGKLLQNPSALPFFKGRPIIVRGYRNGKEIAELLQDLPNINVSWDYGFPLDGEEKAPLVFAKKEEAVEAVQKAYDGLLSEGVHPEEIFVYAEDASLLPPELSKRCVNELLPPSVGYALVLTKHPDGWILPCPICMPFFGPREYKELRQPSPQEWNQRKKEEFQALCKSPSLYCFAFYKEGD